MSYEMRDDIDRCQQCGEYISADLEYCDDCFDPEPYEDREDDLDEWYEEYLEERARSFDEYPL